MMLRSGRFAPACVCLVMAVAGLHLVGCGSASPTGPAPVTLLDTTIAVTQGVTCNIGYVGVDFQGLAGKTVAIVASGAANLTPLIILYAPDFATRLSQSSSSAAGAASLTFALTQSGLHHLSICDVNGVGGMLRVTVRQE